MVKFEPRFTPSSNGHYFKKIIFDKNELIVYHLSIIILFLTKTKLLPWLVIVK